MGGTLWRKQHLNKRHTVTRRRPRSAALETWDFHLLRVLLQDVDFCVHPNSDILLSPLRDKLSGTWQRHRAHSASCTTPRQQAQEVGTRACWCHSTSLTCLSCEMPQAQRLQAAEPAVTCPREGDNSPRQGPEGRPERMLTLNMPPPFFRDTTSTTIKIPDAGHLLVQRQEV